MTDFVAHCSTRQLLFGFEHKDFNTHRHLGALGSEPSGHSY